MHGTVEFLLRHGYLVLMAWVFAEQAGLPVPSLPLLLAAGVLAGAGKLSFAACLLLSMIASLAGDTLWYLLGRKRGIGILQWLCKISLEPDSCVRRTEGVFEKYGSKSLLVAKFLPGLSTVAPPLAGVFHMRFAVFYYLMRLAPCCGPPRFLAWGMSSASRSKRSRNALDCWGVGDRWCS